MFPAPPIHTLVGTVGAHLKYDVLVPVAEGGAEGVGGVGGGGAVQHDGALAHAQRALHALPLGVRAHLRQPAGLHQGAAFASVHSNNI